MKYLVWIFALAYIIQAGAALISNSGDTVIRQLVIAAAMFVPALYVLLSGVSLTVWAESRCSKLRKLYFSE